MDFFTVTEKKNNNYPNLMKICTKEDWAKGLCIHDIEGFAIGEDGNLYLLDECGSYRCAPYGRFRISAVPDDKPGDCPFCGKPNVKTVFSACGKGSGIGEHLNMKRGVRCVCECCGASGPVVPLSDDDDEEDCARLASIMWNMALKMPRYKPGKE